MHKNQEMTTSVTAFIHHYGTSIPLWVTIRQQHCSVDSKMEEKPPLQSEQELSSPAFTHGHFKSYSHTDRGFRYQTSEYKWTKTVLLWLIQWQADLHTCPIPHLYHVPAAMDAICRKGFSCHSHAKSLTVL